MSTKSKSSKAHASTTTTASPASTAAAATAAAASSPAVAARPTAAGSATLQVFWDLAKEDATERLAACERLLAGLQEEQKVYTAAGGAKGKQVKKEDDMDTDEEEDDDKAEHDDEEGTGAGLAPTVLSNALCPSLSYALKRLSRGLASSRAGARQGFALALTEILASMPIVQTEDVLAIVEDQVKLSAKANKQVSSDRFFLFFHSFASRLLLRRFVCFLIILSQIPGFIPHDGE
jgi:hypothetical protein